MWCDGLIASPDGPSRMLPQANTWSSAVFVTADGVLRTRQYNAVTGSWAWGDELPLVLEDGHAGYMTKDGWRSVDHCIALAWLARMPGSRLREKVTVRLVDGSDVASEATPRAEQIEWVESDMPDDAPRKGEKWKPLRWKCGLIPVDGRYQISNQGRLKSPFTGAVTEGFAAHGTRWAGVRESGILVDILAAAGLQEERIPPVVRMAREAMLSGYTPTDLADAAGIQESTAWKNTCVAAQGVRGDQLRKVVPTLVGQRLWRAVVALQGNAVLGGSLTDLVAVLGKRDKGLANVDMSAVRLARLAAVAG